MTQPIRVQKEHSERELAIMLANKLLEFDIAHPGALYVHGDPDCDVCILARQFLRAIERIKDQEELDWRN